MASTRRHVLSGLGVAAAALAAGPFGARAQQKGAQSLRVATYGGSWRDAIDQNISAPLKARGVSVEYTLGNPDDNLAKLVAAMRQSQVPFDTIEGSALFYEEAVRSGLYEKIDYAALSNAAGMPSWAREEHQITPVWSPEGIIYNEEKFRAAGLPVPSTFADLADPKLAGKVAFPDSSNVFHWSAVVGIALENGGDEKDLSKVADVITKIKPNYFYTSSVELASKFSSGEIWAAFWGAGWAVRLRRAGAPIGVAYPKFGSKLGSLWPCPVSIVKGTPNRDACNAYLSEWLKAEGPSQFSIATGSIPLSSAARALMRNDELSNRMLLLGDEQIENCFRVNWAALDSRKWRQTWSREVKR
jgi:putative spermidine/putrescine transport system substrate-binding protein